MAEAITIHSEYDFSKMRIAGQLAAQTLNYIEKFVAPGVSTDHLDALCAEFISKHDAIAAPLNYKGYPKSICTSINHVVCHGIPSDQKLKDGDIINIDVTVIVDGYYGDSSRTIAVGNISAKAQHLIAVTYDAMMLAIEIVAHGVPFCAIGKVIERHAIKNGCSVVRDFCGHGIGKKFHAPPEILHFFDPSHNAIMQEGMIFTIEPMINLGSYHTKVLDDGWTAVTRDKSLSAQFEHTIGVLRDGCEIFTKV